MSSIAIVGNGESSLGIQQLFLKAGIKVIKLASWKENYADKLTDVSIVIETFPDEIPRKKEVLGKIDEVAPPGVVLATTTLWNVTEVAAATKRPQRVVGLNFTFNPSGGECLAQIVTTLVTSTETVEACQSVIEKTGVATVVVKDSPGLILDRIMTLTINEAVIMYAANIASIEDIDKITRLCLNWPMGPFEFADLIGLDRILATLNLLSREQGPQFMPCRLLKQMVAIGRLGKKTGRGFYEYG